MLLTFWFNLGRVPQWPNYYTYTCTSAWMNDFTTETEQTCWSVQGASKGDQIFTPLPCTAHARSTTKPPAWQQHDLHGQSVVKFSALPQDGAWCGCTTRSALVRPVCIIFKNYYCYCVQVLGYSIHKLLLLNEVQQ